MDFRHLPPQTIESEMSILGAIFLDGSTIETAHSIITIEDFYRESHRRIFQAMAALADRDEPIDLITVTATLKASGHLEQCGGGAYLATLVDYVPMAANIAFYCKDVAEKAMRRRMITNATNAIQILYSGGEISEAAVKLEAATQPVITNQHTAPVGMQQSVREAIKRLEHRFETKGQLQGLSYGIDDLDAKTSGMHPGQLIIIAGRPSMGKTALACNILASVCATGKGGMLFSLEMSRDDNIDRLAASHSIPYQKIRNGDLGESEWVSLTKAMGAMHEWRLAIDDTPAISFRELRAKARRQAKEGLDLLVVDYLQLMTMSNPRDNRNVGMGEISRGLKQLARELGIPVIALSQLNRAVDSRPDKRPMMSDLRESGEIEQDADVILFPFRAAAYCQKCKDRIEDNEHSYKKHQAKAEIIIEKQRAGERNVSVPVVWLGPYQKFVGGRKVEA